MKPTPDMELKRELALRIKQVRLKALLNQTEFAKSIGVGRVHLSRMETPGYEGMPSKPVLKKLCETYNVNPDWLMTGNGEMYVKDKYESATPATPALVEQTIEYVSLKTNSLLKQDTMEDKYFSHYFQLFTELINLVFRLMKEVREYYNAKKDVPEELCDLYVDEFKKILKK